LKMKHYADEVNLHARIYAMKGRFLSLEDYAALTRDKGAIFDRVPEAHDYIEAKEMIFARQIKDVLYLAEATEKYTPLFLAFLRWFEANNAKLILAKAYRRQVQQQWYDIGPYATLDKGLLQDDLTLSEIKAILAKAYLDDEFEHVSGYERLEMRIDMCALRTLHDSSSLFRDEAKEVFESFMLKRIAVITLIWHYRLKENYHWEDHRIRRYLESLHRLFGNRIWPQVRIVKESLTRRLEQTGSSAGTTHSCVDIEYYLEQYYYRWVSSMFYQDFHSIRCVVAYLWLLTYEVRNLFRIIEGMRFSLSAGEILEGIISEV
jgi:vacuolar-type H+-ATPase subunit C/Vma6